MKQVLLGQGMYREQKNSHLGWPDPTHRVFVKNKKLTLVYYLFIYFLYYKNIQHTFEVSDV